MFPLQGLTPEPIISEIEVPFLTSKRFGQFWGSTTGFINEFSNVDYTGARTALWSYRLANGQVVVNNGTHDQPIWDSLGPTATEGISEVSIAWDRRLNIVGTFAQHGDVKIRYLTTNQSGTPGQLITENISQRHGGGVRTPRVTFDDRRMRFRKLASTIIGYMHNNRLIILSSDDEYRTPLIIKEFDTDDWQLHQIAMGENNRLHFAVYRNKDNM